MSSRTNKRFIRTGRYEMWRHLRWCAWLIIPVNIVQAWRIRGDAFLAAVSAAGETASGFAAASAVLALQMLLISAVPFIIWWSVCTIFMSRARHEASFSPTEDLEYYRDTLGGVSAVQVSMLADLRMEPREDAAATLLSLAGAGIVSLDGNRISIADPEALAKLPRSERLLARFAAADQLGTATTREWAAIAEDEAADGILLVKTDEKSMGILPYTLRGCGMGCLIIVAASLLFGATTAMGVGSLLEVMENIEDDYDLVPYLVEKPLVLIELVLFVALALFLLVGILLPLIDGIRGIVENGDASRRYRRTQLGERATECVYGIRNYLRDFTALSDADRAALMLWDDFAVYAIALGNNPRAVDEILSLKGIERSALGL